MEVCNFFLSFLSCDDYSLEQATNIEPLEYLKVWPDLHRLFAVYVARGHCNPCRLRPSRNSGRRIFYRHSHNNQTCLCQANTV
jgi:hypothetical protein